MSVSDDYMSIPTWVPEHLRSISELSTEHERTVIVDAAHIRDIEFETTQSDWTIVIAGGGATGQLKIDVGNPAPRTTWKVQRSGGHRISIGRKLYVVHLVNPTVFPAPFALSGSKTRLYMTPGSYHIDSANGNQTIYEARTLENGDLTLDGTARFRELSCDANVDIRDSIDSVRVQIGGNLTVRGGPAANIEGVVGGDLSCRGISGHGSLAVHGDMRVKGHLTGSGSYKTGGLEVTGAVRGEDTPLLLEAATSIKVHQTVTNSALICRSVDSLISIGVPSPAQFGLTDPGVTLGSVNPSTTGGMAAESDVNSAEGCAIISLGSAKIRSNVANSTVNVGERLEIGGSLTVDESSRGWAIANLAMSRMNRELPNDRFYANRFLVGESVDVPIIHQVRFLSLFSCLSLKGRVACRSNINGGRAAVGAIEGGRLIADEVGISEKCAYAFIDAGSLLHIESGTRSSSVAARGSVAFGRRITDPFSWIPSSGSEFRLAGGADVLLVDAPTEPEESITLRSLDGDPIDKLVLSGQMHLEVEGGGSGDGAPFRHVTLQSDAHLVLPSDRSLSFEVEAVADAAITQRGSPGTRVAVRASSPEFTLTLDIGSVVLRTALDDTDGDQARLPCLDLKGGLVEILSRFRHVGSTSAVKLTLKTPGQIDALAGEAELRVLIGSRIIGAGILDRRISAPVMTRIDADALNLSGGELVGVDVTKLAGPDIRMLSNLHVFEPDAKSLIEYAERDLGRVERQERSQRLKILVDTVSDKALSGTSRSAVLWASARAHHSAVDRRHWIENALRSLHRLVGYGYRPRPAVLTYLTCLVLTALVLSIFDSEPPCATSSSATSTPRPTNFIASPYNPLEQLARVVLLPVGLLRLELGGASTYAPIGCSAGWHALAFAINGITLVYLLLALRNYLRTPKES